MNILESERQLINDAINSIGLASEKSKQSDNDIWNLHRGNIQLIVVAQTTELHNETKKSTICMMSPIVNIPEDFPKKLELYEFILDANHKFNTESFSISNQWLILSSNYFLSDMRLPEIVQMLESTSFYAQKFWEVLHDKFDFK